MSIILYYAIYVNYNLKHIHNYNNNNYYALVTTWLCSYVRAQQTLNIGHLLESRHSQLMDIHTLGFVCYLP